MAVAVAELPRTHLELVQQLEEGQILDFQAGVANPFIDLKESKETPLVYGPFIEEIIPQEKRAKILQAHSMYGSSIKQIFESGAKEGKSRVDMCHEFGLPYDTINMVVTVNGIEAPLHEEELFRDRDLNIYEQIMTKYEGAMYAVALKIIQDEGLAEDIVQDVKTQIWLKANTYKPGSKLVNWILGIVQNKARDYLRRMQSRPQTVHLEEGETDMISTAPDTSPSFEEQLITREKANALHQSIRQLPQVQREVITDHYIEGRTHIEISRHRQISLGTVKTRLRLGLRRLGLDPNIQQLAS